MEGTIISLIPPLLALAMVVITRRVLLSLGTGIVAGALIISGFSPAGTIKKIYDSFAGTFVSDGALNTWNVYILLFLLLLGMMTAFISMAGGSRAFGEWALKRVKTRAGAQIVTAVLGVLIFIDDYFNSLAVGQVSRPLTDRHKVSRAKLAYIIDSTSAPICVISPVSSWGAYIIALIGTVLATHNVTGYSAFSAFIAMIPMNIYVFVSILMVFAVAVFNLDFGSMKVHENRAMNEGHMTNPDRGKVPGELKDDLPVSDKGTVGSLVWPIVVLVIATVGSMILTGRSAVIEAGAQVTVLTIFENTDVAASLLYGGLIGFAATIAFYLKTAGFSGPAFKTGIVEGIRSMLPAVYILVFAWSIVTIIDELGTGSYLAGLVEQSNMNVDFLPVALFAVAGIMAFATGTSWGTFGIMLPIAGEIAAASDITLLLPSLAAVLAGSVFGDHCSPISDTTILSSTGAGSHHIDHVLTQLPYAISSAVISAIGYVVLGLTGNTWIALAVAIIILAGAIAAIKFSAGKSYGEANESA